MTDLPPRVVGHTEEELLRLLAESEEEYRHLFQSNPHPIWVFDAETLAFLAVNDAAVSLYGYSRDEFLGMTIKDIRPPEEVPALLEYLKTMPDSPSVTATQTRHRKKDGSALEVMGSTSTIQFRGRRARLVLADDVSERRHLEAQLRQAQKMEAVGRLAGGVAHDFNNALGVILGYAELLLPTQANEGQRHKLEQIMKAARHASGLTHQLLAFSRNQVVDLKVVDLNALLSDLETMLGRLIGEGIDVAFVHGANLGRVRVDPGQLEQVVINLCVNARDAMSEGGPLLIETANAELDADSAARLGIADGRYVTLAVTDAGGGIEKEILDNIFEPFFTTKARGKGTGLGLAMVHGIVQQAGGHISVDSVMGRGTTFKIFIPRIDEPVVRASDPATALPSKGSETILLVEDESSLRALAREVLAGHGYRVIEAASGKEALALAANHLAPIDLLVTDVVMPGMNGRALAESLTAVRPGTKVLYMSGYTDDVIANQGVLEPGTLLLQKPFTVGALLRRVHAALS